MVKYKKFSVFIETSISTSDIQEVQDGGGGSIQTRKKGNGNVMVHKY